MESEFVDQLGERIHLTGIPKRIISLVPSQTELLYDLGLDQEVAGITKFCVHPDSWFKKPKVGGTKDLWFDRIDELLPDLIIGNKEENDFESIEKLKARYPVWMSDIITLEDALNMILALGAITRKESNAEKINHGIREAFGALKTKAPHRVLYLIWKDPWMGAGKGTFIDAMLAEMGLTNCLEQMRYPELTDRNLEQLAPDIILLSSEPYPFKGKHVSELQHLIPAAKIMLVNGQMFSWYGSRLMQAPVYFNSLPF